MATQRSNEPEPLGIVGSISRSAGTMVGTVAAIGRKITTVWRNAFKAKKVREKQKTVKPKKKRATAGPKKLSHPRKRPKPKAVVKKKAATKTKKPQRRVAKAKTSISKPDKKAPSTELEMKIQPLPSAKGCAETKVVTESQKPQARMSDGKPDKTAASTEPKTKIHRLEDELDDLKYPPVDLEDEYFDD